MVSDARAHNSVCMDGLRFSKNYGCHPLDGLSADAKAVGVVPICSNSPGRRLADDDDVDDDSDSDDDDHPHLLDSPGCRPAGSNSGFLEFFDSGSDLDSAGLPMLVVDNCDLW